LAGAEENLALPFFVTVTPLQNEASEIEKIFPEAVSAQANQRFFAMRRPGKLTFNERAKADLPPITG
jgi:hypothetical protein